MNKRERVRAAVAGAAVDRVPAGFWLHFPPAEQTGSAAVQAHLRFYRETDVDILKVMNEHLYQADITVRNPADWRQIRAAPVTASFYQQQLDEIKQVCDAVGDEAMVIATVHGVFASAFHASRSPEDTFARGNPVSDHLRADPEPVLAALDAVADSLAAFSLACLDAGAAGIYYAALGGESYRFSQEEFERYIKPYDLRVLRAVEGAGEVNILHMCKDNVRLEPYADYPAHVVNWGENEDNPPLEEGRALFGRPILGGVHFRGPVVNGPESAIRDEVHGALDRLGAQGLLLGADCTLPTSTPYANIRAAVHAAATWPGN